jgi:hypothetical protein
MGDYVYPQCSGFRCQRRLWPRASSLIVEETRSFIRRVNSKMNIEHRTLNVQHRIMYSVYLKKRLRNTRHKRQRCASEHRTLNVQRRIMNSVYLKKRLSSTRHKRLRCASESTLRNSAVFRSRLQRDSLVLK